MFGTIARTLMLVAGFTAGLLTTATAAPEVINDRQITATMERELAKFLEQPGVTTVEALKEQLVTRRGAGLELPHPAPGGSTHTHAQIFRQRADSVVGFGHLYKCDHCDEWHANIAGGVMLTADGIGVTNYHVLEQEKAAIFGIITRDRRVFPVLEILAASKEDDAAIFRVAGEGFATAVLSAGDEPGEPVTAITHPNGNYYMVTDGIVARNYLEPRREGGPRPRIAITADYAKGSSGCGIYNARGELAAIVTSTRSIYYDTKDGIERNLQMVLKVCIPAAAIRQLAALPAQPADPE
jgi:S1-C subfamily serine protease